MSTSTKVKELINNDLDNAIKRLFDLLKIPSISADKKFENECRNCAEFVAKDLSSFGFESSVEETGGHPIVIGTDHSAGKETPHILFYGHYDVQPPDPIDLWESGPFDPFIRNHNGEKQIVARGACDDKGQFMTFVEAIRAWKKIHGKMPFRTTILIEGEEEVASANMYSFLEKNKNRFKADACIVCDTGMLGPNKPAITSMLRGLVYLEIKYYGPDKDLHSGSYGGAVANPLNWLSRAIGNLHDEKGKITIDGFYDNVSDISQTQKSSWDLCGFDENDFLNAAGLKLSSGEANYSTLERIWARPTCDCNGIYGGYTGEGAKTVLPSHATAKISCRLVPGQDPIKIQNNLKKYFNKHAPPGGRVEFKEFGAEPAVVAASEESNLVTEAVNSLETVFNSPAPLIGCGGSIPIVAAFKDLLNTDVLLIGYSLDDDCIHSPNEKYNVECFRKGTLVWAELISRINSIFSKD